MGLSSDCLSARIGDRLVAIWGLIPLNPLAGKAMPWLVGTDLIDQHTMLVAYWSSKALREMSEGYSYLENLVWAEHERAIVWLRWLGFTVEEPKPVGHKGAMFRRFWKRIE